MKRNRIFLILIVLISAFVITDFKTEKKLKKDGVLFALTVDGKSVTSFPNYDEGQYIVDIECKNGKGKWMPLKQSDGTYEWKLVVENVTGDVSCNLDFTSIQNKDKLIHIVENTILDQNYDGNGYRYSGENPNNYVWFNNELWRIIGSIPTKVNSSTTENRIKIIRAESIGGLAYADGSNSSYYGAWGSDSSNILYYLLNPVSGDSNSGIYFNSLNGIENPYCVGYITSTYTTKAKCDYRAIGLGGSTSFYGSMLDYVYWNTGASTMGAIASQSYSYEITKQSVQGYVGLMNLSDYLYAASIDYHGIYLSSFGSTFINGENAASNNWLFNNAHEWLGTSERANEVAISIERDGTSTSGFPMTMSFPVRPVVYLNSNVYVVNSNESNLGTPLNPYILAK